MEYELVYHGQEREGDVLANTMAVPSQKVRTFDKTDGDAWRNMLILGNNLQVLKRWYRKMTLAIRSLDKYTPLAYT
jgi:hypothetical protein